MMNDFSSQPSFVTYTALTMMVTMGSHAKGDTGLNTCIKGFSACITFLLRPQRMPIGKAILVAMRKPINTVIRLVYIWSTYVGLPVYFTVRILAFGFLARAALCRHSWR